MIPTPGLPRRTLNYRPIALGLIRVKRHGVTFEEKQLNCEIFDIVKLLIEASCNLFNRYDKKPKAVLSIIGATPALFFLGIPNVADFIHCSTRIQDVLSASTTDQRGEI